MNPQSTVVPGHGANVAIHQTAVVTIIRDLSILSNYPHTAPLLASFRTDLADHDV